MGSCLILRDSDVHDILINLAKDDILELKNRILSALVELSTTEERAYQPQPAVITRPDGRKTLFRAYTSSSGPGIKIVQNPPVPDPASSRQAAAEMIEPKHKEPTLHSVLASCDENGFPKAFMNSDELTAYRTSVSAMILFTRRAKTKNVVLFGSGKTALWHARLLLALRGENIDKITIINRSMDKARELRQRVQQDNERLWRSSAILHILDSGESTFETRLAEVVGSADAIFCTTSSTRRLFPVHYLMDKRDMLRSCYVSSIGSWQPDMVELDPLLLAQASTSSNGVVIVDDRAATLSSCGDLMQSKLTAGEVVELGEWFSMRGGFSPSTAYSDTLPYLGGLIVYKSIGVGITDLAAANFIVDLAMQAKKGTIVSDM